MIQFGFGAKIFVIIGEINATTQPAKLLLPRLYYSCHLQSKMSSVIVITYCFLTFHTLLRKVKLNWGQGKPTARISANINGLSAFLPLMALRGSTKWLYAVAESGTLRKHEPLVYPDLLNCFKNKAKMSQRKEVFLSRIRFSNCCHSNAHVNNTWGHPEVFTTWKGVLCGRWVLEI